MTIEVFERQHPADAPARIEVPPPSGSPSGAEPTWIDQAPSEWMTNLHANAVRVMQYTDPYAIGGAMNSYRYHRADPNGNTVFDGKYFYQYDAWNHLLQVNAKGSLTAAMFDSAGNLPSTGTGAVDPEDIGALVKHQTYDGVGRLIRTSSPIQAPEGWEFEAIEGGPSSAPDPWFTRSERFFYDGVRRIQEVVTDPILADGAGNRVATMSFENENRNGGLEESHAPVHSSHRIPNPAFLREREQDENIDFVVRGGRVGLRGWLCWGGAGE